MNSSDSFGRVHSIETMGAADGPGLRMVIFLQGCPLTCRYCHNPDSWTAGGGQTVTVDDLVRRAIRYKPYFGDEGGVTVSGGEPLLQLPFVTALFSALKAAGLSTVLDTSGWLPLRFRSDQAAIGQLLFRTDLVLLDVKSPDTDRFFWLTGQPIDPLAAFLSDCQRTRIPLWIRQVVVPGWNDQPGDIRKLADFLGRWPKLNLKRIQLLPYHAMGEEKWRQLGRSYPLSGIPPMPPDSLEDLQKRADGIISCG